MIDADHFSSPYRSHKAKCNKLILFLNFCAKTPLNYRTNICFLFDSKGFYFDTTGMKLGDIDY